MGIVALIVLIGATVVVNVILKRDIAEALFVGLVGTCLVGGLQAPQLLWYGVTSALASEVTFAAMAFVFMGIIVQSTGLIDRLITILDSIFGRLRGGAGYVSTVGAAMIGLIAGNGAGNAATVGTVTIPWMKETGWSSNRSATIIAGNAGLGIALPPNSTMFILLAMPAAAGASPSSVYVALACAGGYAVLYRLFVIGMWTRKDGVPRTPHEKMVPFPTALRRGWTSPFIFLGIIIPVILTVGPLAKWFTESTPIGEEGLGSISIIVWVPILITIIALIEGRHRIRQNNEHFRVQLAKDAGQFATVGISLFAALAAANVMQKLGLSEQLEGWLDTLSLPKMVLLGLIIVIVVIVATPLSSTATAASVGAPALAALVSAGIDPTVAIIVLLLCTSTEGASPPIGAPIYLAAAMAKADPPKMFPALIAFYVLPVMLLAWVIGMGILPLWIPG